MPHCHNPTADGNKPGHLTLPILPKHPKPLFFLSLFESFFLFFKISSLPREGGEKRVYKPPIPRLGILNRHRAPASI